MDIKENKHVWCVSSLTRKQEGLAQELYKPVIKKFKREKVYARFKDKIWATDLAEIGSLSPFNCSVKYLLCVIDVFAKYA